MSFLTEGPLAQFRQNHQGLVRGASVGGLPGAAAGALYDWGASRGWWGSSHQQIQSQPMVNAMQDRTNQATQDSIWGNHGAPAAPSSGMPEGYSMDPNATSMGPPAPTEDAPASDRGDRGPQGRRDGYRSGLYGVQQFSPGMTVITGDGDPNSRYRNRGTDFGG